MHAIQLLEQVGEVRPADDAVIEAAVDLVLTAAFQEGNCTSPASPTTHRRHRRRRMALGGTTVAGVAAAVLAVVTLLPSGGGTGSQVPLSGTRSRPAPTVLTSRMVRLISSQSEAATADSGTAVETVTNKSGSSVVGAPTTIDATFSGQNVNYLIASDGDGAQGVENRVVDGQLYLYEKGPDLQMHWYHDTSPNAVASETFPDPRTLLQAISPSAGLENLGRESVGGVELTHLRATTPGSIGELGMPDVGGNIISLDVWVDGDDVVRQMTVSSSSGGHIECAATPGPAGSAGSPSQGSSTTCPDLQAHGLSTAPLVSTLDIRFANLGASEDVTAPSGAVDQRLLG
jgi:hypothetical protein